MGGPKGSVLGHAPALDHVPVVIQEVAVLRIFKDLPRARVFLADVGRGVHPPEIMKDRLVQAVVYD